MKTVTVHVSGKNRKLGKIPNISLVPVIDCGNCSYCKDKCYAKKAYRFYPHTAKAWNENSEAFRKYPDIAFKLINLWFKEVKPEYFRIHTSGDFLSQTYLNSWIDICKENKGIEFNVMTKMFNLNYFDIPENMHVRFSMWSGMKDDTPSRFNKVWIDDGKENRIPGDAFSCLGKCIECLYCWKTSERDIVIKLH